MITNWISNNSRRLFHHWCHHLAKDCQYWQQYHPYPKYNHATVPLFHVQKNWFTTVYFCWILVSMYNDYILRNYSCPLLCVPLLVKNYFWRSILIEFQRRDIGSTLMHHNGKNNHCNAFFKPLDCCRRWKNNVGVQREHRSTVRSALSKVGFLSERKKPRTNLKVTMTAHEICYHWKSLIA